MKVHTVRVFSSTEKIEKTELLAWKIAAMAADKMPSDADCIEMVIRLSMSRLSPQLPSIGNTVNVFHTVQTFEQAGMAAIMIEDQVCPKRCGHMKGVQVIPAQEMVKKTDAAVAAPGVNQQLMP